MKAPSALSWYIEIGLIDDVLRIIKAGKESTVYLARRFVKGKPLLLAVKVHKPRAFRSFRRDRIYKQGMFSEKRRAYLGSSWARKVADEYWIKREFNVLQKAWKLGVSVPIPIKMTENSILMTYLGDENRPAPKLVETAIDDDSARLLFDQVMRNVKLLYKGGIVHADLSPYNILLFRGKTHLIDFPQAVQIYENPYALDLLYRDLKVVCSFFRKTGFACKARSIFEEFTGFKYRRGYTFEDYLQESEN